jgi:hypothetical protein
MPADAGELFAQYGQHERIVVNQQNHVVARDHGLMVP